MSMYFAWFLVDFLEVHHDSLVALIVYTNNNLIGSSRYLVYAGKKSCSKGDSTDGTVFQIESGKVCLHRTW